MINDAKVLLTTLCESQLANDEIEIECERELRNAPISADKLVQNYLVKFEVN